MLVDNPKYKFSNFSLLFTILVAIVISWFFKWNFTEYPVNFMGGDAEDYYSSLISTFINGDIANQSREVWFLLKTNGGTVNQHPIGVAVLLLPFFLSAYFFAYLFQFPIDGMSFPFQLGVAFAALVYATIGLIYIKKLLQLHFIEDKIIALIIPLLFFGTNLLNYTLSEAGMSHVYSFSLISVFLFHSNKFVLHQKNQDLISAFLILGLILLVRPNNIFILLSIFIWFKSFEECKNFFKSLFTNKLFYLAISLTTLIVFLQSLVWYIQSSHFFHQTYKADGFYFLNPQTLKMLFGFDAGFFIYTPLCLLFLCGLIFMYRENKFSFFAISGLFLFLFYFFSAYCSYTFFDGIGIRVLVDYYALFAFLGAKLFTSVFTHKTAFTWMMLIALVFSFLNLIYCYQANRGILLRAGMTYKKWKYVFLKTGKDYQNCLGGSHELTPYSANHPTASLSKEFNPAAPYDFALRDFGVDLSFDSLGFNSNRVKLKIDCARQERYVNSSKDAFICMALEDRKSHKNKFYAQIKLNEVPSANCCDLVEYNYTINAAADFKTDDKLSVYLWNPEKKPFLINKFSVQVYNYNYQIN